MSRFFYKITYGLEYYLRRNLWVFIINASLVVLGIVIGCIVKSRMDVITVELEPFIQTMLCGSFLAVFIRMALPPIILFFASVLLSMSGGTAWISFILGFLMGISLGAMTVLLFMALGVVAVLYFLLFILIQAAVIICALSYGYAISEDCGCAVFKYEWKQILIFALMIIIICLLQCILYFLILRGLFIF
jgi:hypothetical protein